MVEVTLHLEYYFRHIGNISSSPGILILQGENDTQTPVQQAFMLQQTDRRKSS